MVSNVSVTVTTSCTFQGIVNEAHTANLENGVVRGNIGSTTLKAFCNDNGGFSIHAIGYTDEEYGKTVLSSQAVGDSVDIATGIDTSGASSWAMKLDNTQSEAYPIALDNGFGDYSAIPTTFTKVAHRDSGTDLGTEATGAILTTTYQVYVSSEQPADNYVGKVKYTMVHPSDYVPNTPEEAEAGKISYFPNGNGKVVDTMGDQTPTSSELTNGITLWASNFQRPGYGFAGWNTEYDMSGTNYGPNETITAPSDFATTGLSLYANWIKSAGTMQNWNGCNSLASGAVTALTDNRDGNTYAVAKLADGKCWMIENLRLDNTPELTATNTNNPSLPLTNSWYYKNQQGTLTTSNHLSASSDPTSTNPDTAWCSTNSADCDNQSMLYTGNTTDTVAEMTTTNANIYSYGNYYNWYSATTGRGTYDLSTDNSNTIGDLCPSGWHLPVGGSSVNAANSDFWQLGLNIMGVAPSNNTSYRKSEVNSDGMTAIDAIRSYPNNFIYSGIADRELIIRGTWGRYWSSTPNSSDKAYLLDFVSTVVSPGSSTNYKYGGWAVRCITSATQP